MHALRVRRKEINIVAGKATTHRGTKRVRLCLAGVCVAQYGRQVHPDQTKVVKGQDSKKLVTAGAIKRPLSCPVKGGRKTESTFHNVKRKTEQEEKKKKKDKNENREEKKEN